jgi:glycosyltransferase involved in cell wall biosynthesis
VVIITNGRTPIKQTDAIETIIDEFKRLKIHKNIPIFIHVARCNPLKNQQRLFNVFERLQNESYEFLLLCIGRGYERYTSKFKDNKQIKILGEKNNVGDFLALSDYFVLSSDFEGLPLSLLEAMSVGVIPISTPVGGVKDVIIDGKNGYLCKEISDESLYDKIKQILEHQEGIDRISIINNFKECYSMEICAKQYYLLYNEQNKSS